MERFGGFVAQVFGDGILVYFGYPTAHEHDAERAAARGAGVAPAAARSRHQRPRTDAAEAARHGSGFIPGSVLIAQELLASAGTSRHDVVGEAINLAARLQAEAPPGGIAISQETMELVEGLFACKSLGVEIDQGSVTQGRGLRAHARVAGHEADRVAPAPRRDANGGARSAIERILSCWNSGQRRVAVPDACRSSAMPASARRASCWRLPVGPSSSTRRCCRCNATRSSPARRSIPIGAYSVGRVGLTAEDEERVRYDKISSYLEELGRNTPENRELVASLLGMAAPAGSTAVRRHRNCSSARNTSSSCRSSSRLRARRPVILWIEDAHWLDPSSAELLQDIVTASAQLPVLVVLTMRSFPKGTCASWKSTRPCTSSIWVCEDCLELARSVPGAGVFSDEMISKAVAAAEGVPFFLEQLVISLIEEQSHGPAPHRQAGGRAAHARRIDVGTSRPAAGGAPYRPGGGVHRPLLHAATFCSRCSRTRARQVQERLEALVEAEILRAAALRRGSPLRVPARLAAADGARIDASCRAAAPCTARIAEVLREARRRRTDHSRKRSPITSPKPVRFAEAIGAWLRAGVSAARRSAHVEAIAHIRHGLGLLDQIPDPGVAAAIRTRIFRRR